MAPARAGCPVLRWRTARARSCPTGDLRAREHEVASFRESRAGGPGLLRASGLPLLALVHLLPAAATRFLPALLARYSSSSAFSTSCSRLETSTVRAATPTETVMALPERSPFPVTLSCSPP